MDGREIALLVAKLRIDDKYANPKWKLNQQSKFRNKPATFSRRNRRFPIYSGNEPTDHRRREKAMRPLGDA